LLTAADKAVASRIRNSQLRDDCIIPLLLLVRYGQLIVLL